MHALLNCHPSVLYLCGQYSPTVFMFLVVLRSASEPTCLHGGRTVFLHPPVAVTLPLDASKHLYCSLPPRRCTKKSLHGMSDRVLGCVDQVGGQSTLP